MGKNCPFLAGLLCNQSLRLEPSRGRWGTAVSLRKWNLWTAAIHRHNNSYPPAKELLRIVIVSQLTSSVSSEPCEPLSFPLISSTASPSPSAQREPVHSPPLLPHPWEVQLFRHAIKRTKAMAFKPLPHLPFFSRLCPAHNDPFWVPAPHLLAPPILLASQSCICTHRICTYYFAPAAVHCLSGLHSLPSDVSDPGCNTLLSLEDLYLIIILVCNLVLLI